MALLLERLVSGIHIRHTFVLWRYIVYLVGSEHYQTLGMYIHEARLTRRFCFVTLDTTYLMMSVNHSR